MISPLPAVLALAATWAQTGGSPPTPTPGDDFYPLLISLGYAGIYIGYAGMCWTIGKALRQLKPPKGGMHA
jgi:hypothetical protein